MVEVTDECIALGEKEGQSRTGTLFGVCLECFQFVRLEWVYTRKGVLEALYGNAVLLEVEVFTAQQANLSSMACTEVLVHADPANTAIAVVGGASNQTIKLSAGTT